MRDKKFKAGGKLTLTLLVLMILAGCPSVLYGQHLTAEQQKKIDAALPHQAPTISKKPRRLLVTNLSMRDGQPWEGSSHAIIPVHNYAIEQMGKITGAYEAVFNNDIELFRPENIQQFDAICFLNTVGVLFEDPELKKSLLDYIAGGKGFVEIHDAIATFVQYPVYDQFPLLARCWEARKTAVIPGMASW